MGSVELGESERTVALADREGRAREILRSLDRVAVALSGGVDSAVVLSLAVDELGAGRVIAVTGISDSIAQSELTDAKQAAAQAGVEHILLETREFADPNYLANPTNRCYYCKTELYSQMERSLAPRGVFCIVNGTNLDDLGDFRPGLTAAKEHSVRAPLAEAGLTKADVRAMATRLGLQIHDKPASPCLSSRVQYGEEITPEKLRMIESAERMLRELGVRECRVRHHDNLARIEVPPEWIERLAIPQTRAAIDAEFRKIGYQYVAIDLRGFRSGSMNEVIAFGSRQE